MPNKTLTFKTDILPYSNEGYNLGSDSKKWKVNGYVVSEASEKQVDTSVSSISENLPTSAAVANFVEGKGYLVSTLKGANDGLAELDGTGKVPSSQLPNLGAAATKEVTDNTIPIGPDGMDTNLITGRTLYNAIASTSEVASLF